MSDNILLIILFVFLFFLFLNNKKQKNEKFQNIENITKKYYKYVLSDDENKKYELMTFSQLNFDLQQKILNKIINNEIILNNEKFQNINDTTQKISSIEIPISSNENIFNLKTTIDNTISTGNTMQTSENKYYSSENITLPSSENPIHSSENIIASFSAPEIVNYYKNILDIDYLKSSIEVGSRYIPINDLIFAVRANRMLDENVLSYKSKLLFDENDIINYSVMNLIKINELPKAKLTSYNNILLISVPNDDFNINNKNIFESAIIKDNQISFKNVKLNKIDDLPIALIKLTDAPTAIKIEKEEVFV
jgi:hypothetical protein